MKPTPDSAADPTSLDLRHARGHVAPGFEAVAAVFDQNLARRGELGAAFAACVDGQLVVDLWGGVADQSRAQRWERDTLVGVFSGTKGMVATALLLLVERGGLDLEAPVARYWPEFAAHGKEMILVRDVVSHQARLPGLTTPVDVEEATDAARMATLLAAQPPIAPRSGPVYHAMTFGWLCGELVRRVDGRPVGRLFREEIAAPLGLDAWIGLPERCEPRVARIESGAEFAAEVGAALKRGDSDPIAWSIWSNPPRFAQGELAANLRAWRAAEVPASNGVATARSLATLYGCLARGGEIDGFRLLASPTLAAGRRCLANGFDPYLEADVTFATGFQLQTADLRFGPPADAFGHPGAGGSVHGAWPALRTGFSYAPNLLGSFGVDDPRAERLLDALHRVVG
jgi:CubicO group peptidase (beta-lactamase class C family)